MIPSPPQEAVQFRGETLEPVSPKPVHYPSPSNIPILERQTDLTMLHETSAQIGHPTPFQAMQPQNYDPADASASVANPIYNDPDGNAIAQAFGQHGTDNDSDPYAEAYGYEGGAVTSTSQGTNTIQDSTQTPQNPAAPTFSDTSPSQAPSLSSLLLGHALHNDSQEPPFEADNKQGSHGGIFNFASLNFSIPASSNSQLQEGDSNANQAYIPFADPSSNTASALPSHPNLPPRPPPQEKPSTHPNYTPEDDIRSYHPHSQTTAGASFRAQPGLTPLMTATPASTTSLSYQKTPLSATQHSYTPSTPGYQPKDSADVRNEKEMGDEDEAPWPPEVQRLYDQFLIDERTNVTEGQWDKFPPGSRLFIGNLPTEKVTKRDLFHIFHRHGKLAQISLKQAYGFVQFGDTSACRAALSREQGQPIRGRKMHLEISKPQRNSGNAAKQDRDNARGGNRRRSRSPDYSRGGGQRGVDRYTGGQSSPRERDRRGGRDDYRPGRSPSPPRGGRRRSRDRYRRSRSRSPYSRSRYRSPSPRRGNEEDDLPLPRRAPQDVPDIQIIVLDTLDMNFIAYIEKGFKDRGIRVDVLLLSPRLSEAAVLRRQIVEGVLAVSKLTLKAQQTGKIPLQVFDRSAGASNVHFEEYADLDAPVAAELVIRAKQNAVPKAQYGLPPAQYGLPPQQVAPQYAPPQATPGLPSSLSSAISSLDGSALQQLLGAMQQNSRAPQQSQQSIPTSLTPDLSRLLGQAQQQNTFSHPGQPPQNIPYASIAGNPALAALLGGAPSQHPPPQQPPPPQQQPQQIPQSPGQGQPDMAQLMAQLSNYRR